MQNVLVAAIIVGASYYLIRKALKSKPGGCDCGCEGCGSQNDGKACKDNEGISPDDLSTMEPVNERKQ